jgi:DNA-binding SARP family transcriptional activator
MRVRVLGDLEVVVADEAADLGGPKPRALLGLLVAAEGRPVTVEQLIDQMWGEDPPARVEASLQSYVARLRRVLEPGRDAGSPAQPLRTHAGGYSLDVATDDVDARRFTVTLREARATGDPARAATLLEEALLLWQGVPYSGLACPSLTAEATRLEELRLTALADLWDLRIRQGEHAGAVPELEQLVRLHPLRERLWALLALALYRDARQGDALAALRRARDHLAEELGVDPGAELRDLEESILRQDRDLDATTSPAPVAPAPDPAAADAAPLIGRDEALRQAAAVLAAARSGRGRVVLVSGEPGIGKTRLAEALVGQAEAAGFRTGRGGWEAEACPPLWGWTRGLRQLLGSSAMLEEAASDGDAAAIGFRQGDAVLEALGAGPPSLLVLDDAHWADTESLRLLRRVAAGLTEVPAVLVVALRAAPAEISDPLADALGALARTDPLRFDLTGLDAGAVAAWVAGQAGRVVPERVAVELTERTEGNPFYLTELVRLLVSEGALGDPDAGAWATVPTGVRDVVRQRMAQLSEQSAAVLLTAAVVGRSFDLAVVAAAHGVDETVVEEAVEDAQVRGMLDDEKPGRYRFAHALVRDALYETAPATARARLHAAVGAAIEGVHAGRVDAHAAELAEHYRLAGPAHLRSAWVFARRAAVRSADGAAHDEAVRWYAAAAELQALDPTVEAVESEQVLVGLAFELTRIARPLEAWKPAARAARSALDRGDAEAAAAALLTVTHGVVWGWRSHPDWDDDAIALWEEALAAYPADDVNRSLLTAALAVEHLLRPGSSERATRLADEAVAAVRRSGRPGADELQVLRLAQNALMRPDLLHHRMPFTDEIIALAARLEDPLGLASALVVRAQDRAELGRLDEAHSDVVRARDLAEQHQLPQNLMVTGWCLALRHQMVEDFVAAEGAIADNEEFQSTLAMSGNGIGLCQLSMLRDLQGRLPELEPMLRGLRSFHPGLREVHTLAMTRTGDLDTLRVELGPWAEQPALTWDYLWLFLSAVRAEVWVALGDADAAEDLRSQLLPYAERLAMTIAVGFRGSVHHTLGRLAGVTGDLAAASSHLEQARAVHERLGLPLWVRRSEDALAGLPAG